jgi:hypothetical protein
MENKGIESLKAAVIKDCEKEGCFNPEGCDYIGKSKCFHKYCDKYKWVIDRADMYAKFLNITKEEVIEAWEKDRSYWYMNYYQDCNQPEINGEKVIKLEHWISQLKEKYGEDKSKWSFKCPSCGHIQSMGDFEKIGVDPQNAYCNCIGRYKQGLGGCDWSINGLLAINKTTVISQNLRPVKVFEIA